MNLRVLSTAFANACLIIIYSSGVAQPNTREMRLFGEFGKRINADLIKDNLHGSISVAVIKHNQVIWADAFGYASRDENKAADTNTIYRIGSITKTFTAVLMMQLVEEGKIKLDDPVEKYIPEVKSLKGYSDRTIITLRQLASHTSGLKREPELADANTGPLEQWESKVLACIPYTSFNSAPGTFLYSNIGFALLGLALERASGMPYLQMIQEKIFVPLGLDDTFFAMPADKLPRLAQGIDNNDEKKINTSLPLKEIGGRGYRVPNGGIYATPRDLAKFVIALMKEKTLLKSRSFEKMKSPQDGAERYGLGLSVFTSGQLSFTGHNGSVPGYTAQFLIAQDKDCAVILMRNYNKGQTELGRAATDLLKEL